jgi:uncharacterized OsmC-like protein
MTADPRLIETIKLHVKKRREATDEAFLFGAERVDIKLEKHLKFNARKREFVFTIDEPADRGGTDTGPNPLAYFIAGAISCLLNQFAVDAIANDIELEGLEATARGHFNRKLGGAFEEIIYDIRLTSKAGKEQIRSLAREAEEMCYAHNTLKKAGVKMKTNLYLNGEPVL